jgi:co-chaperonin GroES (HSP10)
MIKPINLHVLIDPIKQEGFMASSREVFEEIGVVLDYDYAITGEVAEGSSVTFTTGVTPSRPKLQKGDKVYFDAWLAAKFPNKEGGPEAFYWLVKWEDIRAIEYAKG